MIDPGIHHPLKTISGQEAMGLSRRERRILGKQNGVKIPGNNTIHIKLQVIKRLKEKNFPEFLIEFYDKNNRMPTDLEFKKLQDESTNK